MTLLIDNNKYYTSQQAAKLLQISLATIYQLMKKSTVDVIKYAGKKHISGKDLSDYYNCK